MGMAGSEIQRFEFVKSRGTEIAILFVGGRDLAPTIAITR